MTAFFVWHRKHGNLFTQDLKLETEIPGAFFLILYCSLMSPLKNSVKQ